MQAVRLARYHTRRSHLVRFCGAYHGWWGDVQPGVGNPLAARETYTLKDMDEAALRVLETPARHRLRARQSAAGAASERRARPGDSTLVDSGRSAHFDRAAYCRWLAQTARRLQRARHRADFRRGVRRLPACARAARRNISACAPTWSPTARRWPAACRSACCADRREFMRRFREDRPADICFARGTFNAHPYVMGAMYEFLQRLDSDAVRALYAGLDALWNGRAQALNERLSAAQLPVRVANLSTIWTICYTQPSRYNWMLQYYLRAAGLALSLGRHGPADFQPQLHRRGLRRGRRQIPVGGPGDAARTAGGGRSRGSPTNPSGAASSRR